eukprot:gene9842-2035_t
MNEDALVVEVGGLYTRSGEASAMIPNWLLPCWDQDTCIEYTNRPVQNGIVSNWEVFENQLKAAIDGALQQQRYSSNNIGENPSSEPKHEIADMRPLLLVDTPAISDKDRERTCELLMEKFNVPAYFVLNDVVASVYSAGRTSSFIFDIGYDRCQVGAVHEGFLFPHTWKSSEVGGKHVTAVLCNGFESRGHTLDLRTAESLKLSHARVASNFEHETQQLQLTQDSSNYTTLPDGRKIALSDTHVRATECVFQPLLVGHYGPGLSDMLIDMVNMCHREKETQPLYNLPLFLLGTGGTSQLRGLVDRIYLDVMEGVKTSSSQKPVFVSVLEDAPDRHHAAWIGGSIVASLPRFVQNNFVSHAEYSEVGASTIHRHC